MPLSPSERATTIEAVYALVDDDNLDEWGADHTTRASNLRDHVKSDHADWTHGWTDNALYLLCKRATGPNRNCPGRPVIATSRANYKRAAKILTKRPNIKIKKLVSRLAKKVYIFILHSQYIFVCMLAV